MEETTSFLLYSLQKLFPFYFKYKQEKLFLILSISKLRFGIGVLFFLGFRKLWIFLLEADDAKYHKYMFDVILSDLSTLEEF